MSDSSAQAPNIWTTAGHCSSWLQSTYWLWTRRAWPRATMRRAEVPWRNCTCLQASAGATVAGATIAGATATTRHGAALCRGVPSPRPRLGRGEWPLGGVRWEQVDFYQVRYKIGLDWALTGGLGAGAIWADVVRGRRLRERLRGREDGRVRDRSRDDDTCHLPATWAIVHH